MKITEIINKVEKTPENECFIPISLIWHSLGMPTSSIPRIDNCLKGYWLQRHNCDIMPFGIRVYFLDNEPIAISITKEFEEENIENFHWINSLAVNKTKKFLESYLPKYNPTFKLLEESKEISDTYKIKYVHRVSDWSKGTYYGIKIKRLIRRMNKAFALIELENGKEVYAYMYDIKFSNNISE